MVGLLDIITPEAISRGKYLGDYLIFKYFELGEYFKTKWAGITTDKHKYDFHVNFWKDVLGPYYKENGRKKPVVNVGDKIVLEGMDLAEWFPLSPGKFHTISTKSLDKYLSVGFDEPKEEIYCALGYGVIRFREHKCSDGNIYKLLTAVPPQQSKSLYPAVEAGIPLVMKAAAYNKIRRKIIRYGSINCTLEGVFQEIPDSIGMNFINSGVPLNSVVIKSPLLIKDVRPGEGIVGRAWTLIKGEDKKIKPIYETFHVDSQEGILKATNRIKKRIEKSFPEYNYQIITDFDEMIRRFAAKYTPTDIVNRQEPIRNIFFELNSSIIDTRKDSESENVYISIKIRNSDKKKILDFKNKYKFKQISTKEILSRQFEPTGYLSIVGRIPFKKILEIEREDIVIEISKPDPPFYYRNSNFLLKFYLKNGKHLIGKYIGRTFDNKIGEWASVIKTNEGIIVIAFKEIFDCSVIIDEYAK